MQMSVNNSKKNPEIINHEVYDGKNDVFYFFKIPYVTIFEQDYTPLLLLNYNQTVLEFIAIFQHCRNIYIHFISL